MAKHTDRPELKQTETIDELPLACANELAACEFLEARRWRGTPCCMRCGSTNVYKMMDAKTGLRNKRFLWRCRDCEKQYTVRLGTIMEDSPIPLRHWCRAMWEASTSKTGVSSLEISRKLQISYKSALFMMHRIRHAMTDNNPNPPRFDGDIEVDETYVGGKVRHKNGIKHAKAKGAIKAAMAKKTPVMAMVKRGGDVRTRVVPNVRADNVFSFVSENADPSAMLYSDGFTAYKILVPAGLVSGHESVNHFSGEYVRKGDSRVHSNTVESFFSRVKRGLNGVFFAVSKEHLHRYMHNFEFLHNTRKMTDGARVDTLILMADGKRLTYDESKISA